MNRFVLFFSAASFFASLCVAQGTPPNAASAPNEKVIAPPVEYSSIRSYLEPYSYRGSSSRDPFRPPEIPIPLVKGSLYGPFLPLQNHRIENLTLKGLFWNVKKPRAIVAVPDGTTYKVGIKDYVGENFGYVASIREKEMVIIQTVEEGGKRYSTTKVMFFNNSRRTQ